MLDAKQIEDWDGYGDWVETKVKTKGDTRLFENTLGLCGEAGEVAEKIKKSFRDGTFDKDQILKELGDVLFYTVALANYVGGDLRTVVEMNIEKLDSRERRGVLGGSGDNR